MRILSNAFGTISNIAFTILLIAFVLKNFQSLSAETFKTLSLIAWASLAFASFIEGFLFVGKNKLAVILAGLSVSATAIFILSKIMSWQGFEKLEYAPYTAIGAGVILLIAQKKLSNIGTKALIVGTIGILIVTGKL
jgi:hypothetical protein